MAEIITQPQTRIRQKQAKEGILQASLVRWYYNEYGGRKGSLIAIFNESRTSMESARKLSLGMAKSASDLVWCDEQGRMWGLEVKEIGMNHSVSHLRAQVEWLLTVPYRGFFIDSLESFHSVITTGEGGVRPEYVRAYLRTIKTGSIAWDREKFAQTEINV
jgi:hypothetical protein